MAPRMLLAAIHVYPLKGARGVSLARADVLTGGLRHDRRFMIVDEGGRFVTQREEPSLALLETELRGAELVVRSPIGGEATLPLRPDVSGLPRARVRVFGDETEAVALEGPVNDVVTRHLAASSNARGACTVVYMPDDVVRPVEAPYGRPGDKVGFADAYPVLVATEASLAALNERLPSPVPMNRFRPNLVVAGGAAWDEERFARARIGSLSFRMPKRCARCAVTTVDQATAAVGKEPLRTMATFRAEDNHVYFALNAIPDGEGEVQVGDTVTYLEPIPADRS